MSTLVFILVAAAQAAPAAPTRTPAAERKAVVDRSEAYYHFCVGLQARFAGDPEGALEEYRKAQKLDPSSAAIRVEIARLLRESGRIEEAVAEARAAVALDQDEPTAHLMLAHLLQNHVAANACVAGAPRPAGCEQALRGAAAEYEEVARLQPTDRQSLWQLAEIQGQLEDHVAAAATWEKYVAVDPGNFDAHRLRGTHLLLAGEPEKAAAALKAAIELRPTARAYQMLGEIYAGAKQFDQSILHLRKSLEIDPNDLRARLALGEVLAQSRQPQEGLGEAETVLLADPANRLALDLKGRCLRDLKRYSEASAVADGLLTSDPNDLKAHYLKVTIAEVQRDYATAAALIEELLARRRAGSAEAAASDRIFLLHLGFAYQQLERYADAAGAFERALSTGEPPDADLLSFHAEALYLAKRKEQALAAVRAARERFPHDVDLTALEATLLRESGETTAATALVEGMRERAPKDPQVLGRVADFYRRAKQFAQAEAALSEARLVDPKSLSVLFQLGAIYERQKRYDEAERVFRQGLAIEPDSAPVLNYLGYMNAERGVKLEESLTLIQKAVDLDPTSAAYRDSLGWALYRLNRLEAAEEQVRKALEKDGDNAVILDHLGDILSKRGLVAEALSCWQKALTGEDEEAELDRPRVKAKISDAQGVLHAQQQQGAAAPTP